MPVGYTRPYLYPKQLDAMFCPQRWSIIEASTKSGKTVSAMAWLLEEAFKGKPGWNYWWGAPVFPQADIAFTRFKNGLTRGSFTPRERHGQPTLVLANGAIIWFKSADNSDSLYGEDVHGAVVDEASRWKEPSWHAIRSTLTATRGPCRIIGNVKGRKNWFYKLGKLARDVMLEEPDPSKRAYHYAKITAYDAVEAGVLDAEEIADAKRTYPEHIFRELYLAEPSDDGGNPFGLQHIEACVKDKLSSNPVVAWGIDLAKKHDYLVMIGLDAYGGVAAFERWHGRSWPDSIREIHRLVGEDTPALVDSTGIGDPVLDQLQVGHGNFAGYMFSPTAKQKLMEGLSVSIQSHEIGFPDGYIRSELEAFEYVPTRTGVAYSAPEGEYDDCVCALALARQQWAETAPGASLMEFYSQQAKLAKEKAAIEIPVDDLGLRAPLISRSEVVDNELTELYRQTLAQYAPEQILCYGCGTKITGPTRVNDGEFVWHPECVGLRHAA